MAEGLKGGAFEGFVFFYYTQVLGLSGTLAGLSLAITVVSDALTDPLMGSISDAHRSKWGRRHPFMYGAAVPLGACFYLVFSPPRGLGELGLFAWMTAFAVLLNIALTAYHLPHMALGAELSSDYRERTSVVSYRAMFQLVSTAAVTPISFYIFFRPGAGFENGQLNPAAYPWLAVCFGLAITAAILATSLGTHSRIPHLPVAAARGRPLAVRRVASELLDALRSPSYVALFVGFVLLLLGRSAAGVLNVHLFTYFWRFSPAEIGHWGTATLAASLIGVPFWVAASGRLDKKPTLLIGLGVWGAFTGVPPLAALLGLFPGPEGGLYVPAILTCGFLGGFGMAGPFVVVSSMIADIGDEHEYLTGRRGEGILFSCLAFSQKFATAIGLQIAGLGVDLIRFPLGASPAEVPEAAVRGLAWLYAPFTIVFTGLSMWLVARYRLTRVQVLELQRELALRSTGERAL